MPTQEITKVEIREQMARLALDPRCTLTEVAERFGVSRPTVRLWRERFLNKGREGLSDRSHAPRTSPLKTEEWIEQLILEDRTTLSIGSKKILRRLQDDFPEVVFPSRATIDNILARHGLVKPRRKRTKAQTPFARRYEATDPGELNTIDFKGEFRLLNGRYCYPLTMVDAVSRYVLACESLPSTKLSGAWKVIQRVFREHGLPKAMLSDNGPPFGAAGHARLSSLSVRLMKLGVQPVFIEPGKPQQNGAHERMHKDLKARASRPPERTFQDQQKRFNDFIEFYNVQRPHEGIDLDRPARRYSPSPRPYPNRVEPPHYPRHFEVRLVSSSGTFKWKCQQFFIGQPLASQHIGFDPRDEAIWDIHFYDFVIGKFDDRNGQVL